MDTPTNPQKYQGIISLTSKAVGYVEVEGFEQDIEIQTLQLNTAMNGDTVEFTLDPKRAEYRQTGTIIRVVERMKTQFVGTVDHDAKKAACYVIPDDRKAYKDFLIPADMTMGAENGDKVQIELTSWDDPKKGPQAKIIRIIGKKGVHDAEMQAIVLERGFDTNYPPLVEREAEMLEKTEKPIRAEEIAGRRDFRQTLTFTIDPIDAKDFDDAISFKKLGDDRFEIGVHIADVSHYVREGTELDREALKRGFSVYLVDRTIPMLPEVLSNDICSLNPHEDKLTFSAVFEMNSRAEVFGAWFGKTIINSFQRFTYENAQEVLNAGSEAKAVADNLVGGQHFGPLDTLNKIAKILQKEKFQNGAINFETDEVKFVLDEAGKPIKVVRKVRGDTHKLVEEYMLLANRGVAEYIFNAYKKENKTTAAFIYRNHDAPDVEKIKDLSIFLKALGYELEQNNGKVLSKDINKLLAQVEGKPEEDLIKTATIRSMAKAVYSTQNIGHFGQAYKFYTHFTSPIRRYADLLVHRLLFRYITGDKIEAGEIAKYERMAANSTVKEIAAAEAERASIKYKQVEFMMDKVGQVFDGLISGVTEWGIYVEDVNTKAEGMIRLRDLPDDNYTFDKKNYCVVGSRTGRKFRLGDKVKFKITRADMESKTLDLAFV